MQRQSIPADIKRLLSADLSKFVKEEIQRIVPILTTDEELSKSAPHAQEYYQDTSSWNYVAVTAIRETFLTMKNSFVTTSDSPSLPVNPSQHLEKVSGVMELAICKILAELLDNFDYEITLNDQCLGSLNKICTNLAKNMLHHVSKETVKGISDYFDEEIHTVSYIECHYSNMAIAQTWDKDINQYYNTATSGRPAPPPPPSRSRMTRVSTSSVKEEKKIPVADEDDATLYPASRDAARKYAMKYCFWLTSQISDRIRKIINLKFLAAVHNYFDGKFLEETHNELARIMQEAEIKEKDLLASSQVKKKQDNLKKHEEKFAIFDGLLKEINSLNAKIERLQGKV